MASPDPSLTPEKRLLQLIEGRDAGNDEGESRPSVSFIDKIQEWLNPEKLNSMIAGVRSKMMAVLKGKEFISLREINKVARVFAVVMGLGLLLNLIYDVVVVQNRYILDMHIPEEDAQRLPMSQKQVFETDLIRNASKIEVFVPPAKRVRPEEVKSQKEGPSVVLIDLIKNWKLAGISLYPDDPQRTFCMIEDLKKNITTFLKTGDSIGGLAVEEIKPDRVVLKLGEDKIELR